MLFPALKRDIHARLVKRIVIVCLAACLAASAAVLYVEYRRIGPTLVDYAAKEALLFLPLFSASPADGGEAQEESLSVAIADHLTDTSFLAVRLVRDDTVPIAVQQRGGADTIAELFAAKGLAVPDGPEPAGRWLLADRQVFATVSIPMAVHHRDEIIGHLQGIYRLSLADSRRLLARLGLSVLLSCGAILICALLLYPGLVMLHNRLIQTSVDLGKANIFLMRTLGAALAKSDTGRPEHSNRVIIYAVRLAEKMNLPRPEIRNLIQGACLHDVGMLGLDAAMLLRQGPLTEKERRLVEKHVAGGVSAVKPYRWLRPALEVIRYHHEKYDGSGYRAGAKHDKIPTAARIFAIVDAFDALTSARPYREAMDIGAALHLLERESGTHFDPVMLAAFIDIAPKLHGAVAALTDERLERELTGVIGTYLRG